MFVVWLAVEQRDCSMVIHGAQSGQWFRSFRTARSSEKFVLYICSDANKKQSYSNKRDFAREVHGEKGRARMRRLHVMELFRHIRTGEREERRGEVGRGKEKTKVYIHVTIQSFPTWAL
jgi:hypothetical protein